MRQWRRHFSAIPISNFSPLSSSRLTHLLQLCSNSRALAQAKQCHQQIIQLGFHLQPFVITKLVQSYAECDHLGYAHKLFDQMSQPNVFAWTALLAFHSRNARFAKCLLVYRAMRVKGVLPDQYVFPKVLRACAQLSDLCTGAMVHKDVIACGAELNLLVCSSLIDMYSKCDQVECSRRVFDSMPVRDLLSYNTMGSGFVANGLPQHAVELFESMKLSDIEPDLVTLNTLMDAYCRMGLCDEALNVFRQISQPSIISWTTLISGYSRAGNHESSLGFFSNMMEFTLVIPDLDSLSSAIVSCRYMRALRIGQEIHAYGMKTHCYSTFYKSAGPALLTMYSKCEKIHLMWNVFDLMDKFDVVTWNAMIFSLIDRGIEASALEAFAKMQNSRIENNQTTISTILPICDLKSGKQIHAYIVRNNLSSLVSVLNALITMYCKCGSIEAANRVFSKMSTRDLISWNTIIGGFAMHGKGETSLQLLKDMISSGLSPNSVTLTSTLAACSHSGLVNEGLELFVNMTRDFDFAPKLEHFSCLVDMLARAGELSEALDIVKRMPMKADKHIWGTLLAAGEFQQDLEVSKLAAENLVCLEPENAGHYVTLSNIYAKEEKWEDAVRIRRLMESKGLVKPTGSSWLGQQN